MRIVDGKRSSFRCVRNMGKVSRKEIQDPTFINACAEKNFAFLKSLTNSLSPIFHTLIFQRNKRIESNFEEQKRNESNFEEQKRNESNFEEQKRNESNFEKQKSHASKVVIRL
ncbi:hypothetical protein AVEN_197695-1 [Araneus ventricosus]|uniref:Uncharacterized protein n=1 Tax=Araneus ventricosus TaxID=182803 RepID=A0A4Y2CLS9_ARAVE|nr:hypothetical protein AVEN_197695-1 [Araneus ventricosus]